MAPCKLCGLALSAGISLQCFGNCKQQFHFKCAKIAPDLGVMIKDENSGLRWYCPDCRDLCCENVSSSVQQMITDSLDAQFRTFSAFMQKQIVDLKSELIQKSGEMLKAASLHESPKQDQPIKTSYASKLIGEPKSKIIIKPIDQAQSNQILENDILQSLNSVKPEVKITEIKTVNNGGLILGLGDSASSTEIKRVTQDAFPGKYSIRDMRSLAPCVKIVGMSTNIINSENFITYLKKQNCEIISANSTVSLKKFWPTKKMLIYFKR